ncbi:HPr(Ser) kinase/phosphatase [Solibaculum mannosilyticum]|uniref:HPr kinase/phosphorylase n=1 Tax=Solibaculum mannosilyticum TaxID=2780922 RepID=A0A7I8D2J2_9FIRM|nr:HPr(Ser) kinase/phosphatase [Solibaculum mannosilyticum]MCO7136559.1 HPr(Ser) kinase/phosphatase [[Clostridium] leptum]BCI61051.1 HPr kinase/phosphorylase [Solibaculum mannosilyticum]CZT55563.1 HPr kinase/phosphorylase [Eubacteriaceae bacterium CHKCI005]
MSAPYSVSLDAIIQNFSLDIVYMPGSAEDIKIVSSDVNRPGLQLNGFFEYFDSNRIQVLGKSESAYLQDLGPDRRAAVFEELLAQQPPVIIMTRNLEIPHELEDLAPRYEVPLLRSSDGTSTFIAALISYLNVELAPRVTRHGVLIEAYGEGILLLGESGVGKSETAIELIKRGHRLIADDAVEIRRVSSRSLVGSSPENIRHFIELRGIGIINARRIFGMGAVKLTEKIDMVIQLELWNNEKVYDRMGMENEYTHILGIRVPMLTIPVKPGRNLAVIIEVAAMNNRQKKMGYNAAKELLNQLGMLDDLSSEREKTLDWEGF